MERVLPRVASPALTLVDRIRAADAIPTWEDAAKIVGTGAGGTYRPYLWKWSEMRALLMEAGDEVTPHRGAERRSIDHVNPTLPASSLSTTHTLGTAMQLVRPGETAPAHRHTAGAIRFVIEAGDERIYTTVNGEKLIMQTRDLILTPTMTWHDHNNESDHDLIWFDVLDYPLVNYLKAGYFEAYPDGKQQIVYDLDYSVNRLGSVRPAYGRYEHETPVLRYPWADVVAQLSTMSRRQPDPHQGYSVTYAGPDGGPGTLPTIGCYVQLLPPGFRTLPYRAGDSRAQVVLDGTGVTLLDGQAYEWSVGDVLSIPPWTWIEHRNTSASDAVFFYASERPLLESLKLWRHERRETLNRASADEEPKA